MCTSMPPKLMDWNSHVSFENTSNAQQNSFTFLTLAIVFALVHIMATIIALLPLSLGDASVP